MGIDPEQLRLVLSLAAEELLEAGLVEAASLLRSANHRTELLPKTGPGSDYIHIINLEIDPKEYYNLGHSESLLRHSISDRLVRMLEMGTSDRVLVEILPRPDPLKTQKRQKPQNPPKLDPRNLFSWLCALALYNESDQMIKDAKEIESSINHNPALALGLIKDVVESHCKTLLTLLGIDYGKSPTLSTLTKALMRCLHPLPEQTSERERGAELIKNMLDALSTITRTLGDLRNLYGSGHGRAARHVGIEPHHAHLALIAATAFIYFVTESYLRRGESEGDPPTP